MARRVFSREFKVEAVRLVRERGASVAQASRELDVRQNVLCKPNRKWIADFTYVWTAEGWLYVAAVINLFSRRVVGWSMKAEMTAQLVTDALLMAIWRRGKPEALLHHSDRANANPLRASRDALHSACFAKYDIKEDIYVLCRPGGDLLSQVLRHSTIGAEAFDGRVRDGIGSDRYAESHQAGEARKRSKLEFGLSRSCLRERLSEKSATFRAHATPCINPKSWRLFG
jgi:Integrase core domain/Transposase